MNLIVWPIKGGGVAGVPGGPRAMPADLSAGQRRALLATGVALAVIFGGLGAGTVAGLVSPVTLLGPHVQRSDWALSMLQAQELNGRGYRGQGMTICLLDSGIDLLHPDFQHLRLRAWRDFVNGRPDPYDDGGHGTSMAGFMVANGSLKGAAPEASLIVAKVTNQAGTGSSADVAAGMRFCMDPNGDGRTDDGAQVISVSLGGKERLLLGNEVYGSAQDAVDQGFVVVASAGNDGLMDDGDVAVPATVPGVVAVGAVDSRGMVAPFSSAGDNLNRSDPDRKPEVVAPGVQLVSTVPGARYATTSGTSPATALAAAVVALVLQAWLGPGHRPSYAQLRALKGALAQSSQPLEGQALPHDGHAGYGLLRASRLVALLNGK